MGGWRTILEEDFQPIPGSDENLSLRVMAGDRTSSTRITGWEYSGTQSDYVRKSYGGEERAAAGTGQVVRSNADLPLGQKFRLRAFMQKIADAGAINCEIACFIPNTDLAVYSNDDYLRLRVNTVTSGSTSSVTLEWVQPGGSVTVFADSGALPFGVQDAGRVLTMQVQWPHVWVYLQVDNDVEQLLFEVDLVDDIARDVNHRRVGFAGSLSGSGRYNLGYFAVEQPTDYVIGSESESTDPADASPITGTLSASLGLTLLAEDSGPSAFTLSKLEAGRSPRVVMDFPAQCQPGPWVQLFYATDAGTIRRDQDERFLMPHTTTITDNNPNRRIEEAFRTATRRLTVVHSIRDPALGTYSLQRMNSGIYPNPTVKPQRPNFLKNVGANRDLFWIAGEAWRDSGGVVTESWNLRVQCVEPVDAIEVGALNTYPSGYRPAFDVQPQTWEAPVRTQALDFHDFPFDLTHGGFTMTPCAFRARTRIGTCYSPWRYFIAAFEGDPPSAIAQIHTELVNCGHDIVVDLPPAGEIIFEHIQRGRPQNPCESESPPSPPGGGGFIEGGYSPQNNGIFTQDWIVGVRSQIPVSFEDENGDTFGFAQVGAVYADIGGGAPPGTIAPFQDPEQFP